MEISIDNESKRFFRFLQEKNNDNIIFQEYMALENLSLLMNFLIKSIQINI